jgi:phosphatidylserine/phosphatidylglycerophosphate/cardiolipin synthase-like enzyme
MAKFLTTKQISSELEQLIQEADKTLYLISPYLKLSKDFQELLNSRNKYEKKTIIIYGKVDLTPEQLKFLTSLRHVYLKFHQDLHAKCYINDTKLIITSLNFYEYSMIHNKEMGVLYDNTKTEDQEIYTKALEHVKFIEDNSNDKPFELAGNSAAKSPDRRIKIEVEAKEQRSTGYCIRTGKPIPFNPDRPFTKEAYESWSKFSNPDYSEKYCHFSGEESNGETSFSKPVMKKNWKKVKELYSL